MNKSHPGKWKFQYSCENAQSPGNDTQNGENENSITVVNMPNPHETTPKTVPCWKTPTSQAARGSPWHLQQPKKQALRLERLEKQTWITWRFLWNRSDGNWSSNQDETQPNWTYWTTIRCAAQRSNWCPCGEWTQNCLKENHGVSRFPIFNLRILTSQPWDDTLTQFYCPYGHVFDRFCFLMSTLHIPAMRGIGASGKSTSWRDSYLLIQEFWCKQTSNSANERNWRDLLSI